VEHRINLDYTTWIFQDKIKYLDLLLNVQGDSSIRRRVLNHKLALETALMRLDYGNQYPAENNEYVLTILRQNLNWIEQYKKKFPVQGQLLIDEIEYVTKYLKNKI
jgi:hypothetical protein